MGVIGLWNLIEDAGTKTNLSVLEGKVLAIDLSIWINQAIKGFRDKDGRQVENAHLLGLFNRVCKLLFYKIKPIFVFDGECPTLKLHTVHRRSERARKVLEKSKNLSLNVIEKFVNSQLAKSSKLVFNTAKLSSSAKNFLSEFYLPPSRQVDIYQNFVQLEEQFQNKISDEPIAEEGDVLVSKTFHHPDYQNVRDIDINSAHFKSLPPATRYEILVEIRDSYKQRKSTNLDLLPTDSDEFSNFQLKKLLKKQSLQEEIEKLIEILNCRVSENDLKVLKKRKSLLNSDEEVDLKQLIAGQLASDENTRFVLFNSKLEKAKDEPVVEVKNEEIKLENEEFSSQNFAYQTPNTLPGQSSEVKHLDRIDSLAKVSTKQVPPTLQSKQLSGHLEKNVQKFQSTELNVKLSESESSSSSSDEEENFIEVSSVDSPESVVLFENATLPYSTDYQLSIRVESEENEISDDKLISVGEWHSKESKVCQSNSGMECVSKESAAAAAAVEEEPDNAISEKNSAEFVNEDGEQLSTAIEPVEEEPEEMIERLIEDTKQSHRLTRQAATVNQQMIADCQELLCLFGVPWIVAPAEAEAQCAALEQNRLCDGIITDDSDIFLFGGTRVYRHFFDNSKHIKCYRFEDLQKFYGLNREKLICLGMLCGTDYTLGVDGIGPVTGMEILSEFPGHGMQSLVEFAKWHRQKASSTFHQPENKVRENLLRFKLPDSFPSRVIFDAYLNNVIVDQSREPFKWSSPQLSELRNFARDRLKWPVTKTDSHLLPVLKKMNEKQVQTRIDYFFPSSSSRNTPVSERLKLKRSKRLNEAIRRNIDKSLRATKKKRKAQSKVELVLSEESSSSD